ncbi:unnamed protein product [Rotaria magnacalcarata]|uniref:AAA+ ATPase domain-containing protein n=2 Tax=Rotaria magnacalcarata TaxID=392030 RepID=A0A816M375_9BILA|nr:unnamed protein product [Rotaria magnacalcarata]CAF1668048.1 unnamed protein product [Rotaria magnacalcarata]CAF1957036.1 unnamed protein product [Rotaria magnacalcarata]
MRNSKTRSSLNVSLTTNESSFRWQKCSQCLKSTPCTVDNHQCSEELEGLFVERNRARLLIQEHKADYFKDLTLPSFMHTDCIFISPETMRLLEDMHRNEHVLLTAITKDQQRSLRTGLLWPNSVLADNQVAINRTMIDQLSEQQMIEIQAIPSDHIHDTANITLSAVTPCESRSTNERRLITICLKYQLANRIIFYGQQIDFVYIGQSITFRIEQPDNDINLMNSLHSLSLDGNLPSFYRISPSITSINIHFESTTLNKNNQVKSISLSDIGGLKKEKSELIDLFLSSATNYIPPRGILLHGPKGCGKTMLINAITHEISASIIRINPSDVYSRHYGESETKLKQLFAQTTTTMNENINKKYVLVVENIESLCPNQERITQQLERRLTTTFIELLDRYLDGQKIFLIATTNRLDSVDTDLRRPGRIDEEIEIGIPNQQDRLEILIIKLEKISNDLNDEQFKLIAERTHGFSGSDLENLCRKANNYARKNKQTNINLNIEHFEHALTVIRPSSMREVILEVPKVKWSDIGGQHELKQRLEEMVVWPLKYSHALDRLNVQVPKGILMYGPPGCSKTMVAKAIATESDLNFIAVKGPELFSKWVGESERAVRELFRRARLAAPAIIFFDEIDAIANSRSNSSNSQSNVSDRVIAALLIEMDGIEKLKGVTIIAATNRPDCIDPALMRPGRFDRLVYVPLPDEQTRLEIFEIRFRSSPIHSNIQKERLVELTKNYSGAEIAAVCDEAALIALRDNIDAPYIEWQHFERALMSVKPRTSDEHIRRLDAFTKQHGK